MLDGGEHLALLLAVDEAVVVLHGYEGGQAARDRVICGKLDGVRRERRDVLCMTLTLIEMH
jgi:hypothetical protein